MSLELDEVRKIAHLARIGVGDEELVDVQGRLSRILDMVAQMQQVDTQGVMPMAHPLSLSQPLRMDAVTEADQRQSYQQIAPCTEGGLYLVPRVIE